MFRSLLLVACLAATTLSAQAQLLVEENFDYTVGTALTANGYTAHSGAGFNPVLVTAGTLTFPGYPSVTGNSTQAVSGTGSREDVHRVFTSQTTGSVYVSLLARVDAATTQEYFFHLGPDPISTNFRARLYLRADAGDPDKVNFGISKSGNATTGNIVWSPDAYNRNETLLLVVKYEFVDGADNDVASLWVFESGDVYSPAPAPDAAEATSFDAANIGSFAIRQHGAVQGVSVDGIRIGLSYGDILPAPAAPSYTVTSPAAGDLIIAGTKAIVRWSGPGVPSSSDLVDIFLRKGNGSEVLIGSGANRGKLKVTIPAGTASGSDYTLVVRRQADPSVFGVSAAFVVSNTAERYTFSEPDFLDFWLRGTTHPVLWTTPPTAPAGTVTIELWRLNTLVASYPGQADDGSFDLPIAANQASVGDYRIEITNETDAAFFGASPKFNVSRVQVTPPAEGAVWAAGSSQTVSWTTGAYNAGGLVKLSLRSVVGAFNRSLANNRPYPEGTRTVTVPADTPAGEYYVQFLYTYTPSGGVEQRVVINSNRFTVTNPASPSPEPQRHFASPLAGEASPVTYVSVRGLSDGAEVGVFAPMGDGTPVLLASSVVEAGEALVAVPSDIVDGDEELSFGPEAVLELRVFADGVESVLEAHSVTTGEGVALSSVRFAENEVVTVDVSKGTAAGTAEFSVATVVPNPTSGAASVRFALEAPQAVRVTVYDALGRVVSTVFDGPAAAGSHVVSLPSSLNAGVYVVRIAGAGVSSSIRFTVVR